MSLVAASNVKSDHVCIAGQLCHRNGLFSLHIPQSNSIAAIEQHINNSGISYNASRLSKSDINFVIANEFRVANYSNSVTGTFCKKPEGKLICNNNSIKVQFSLQLIMRKLTGGKEGRRGRGKSCVRS